MSYGGYASTHHETRDRVTQCQSCGKDMVGPRSRNKGVVTSEGKVIGSRRELDSAEPATCSNCVSAVTYGRRRETRALARIMRKAAKA